MHAALLPLYIFSCPAAYLNTFDIFDICDFARLDGLTARAPSSCRSAAAVSSARSPSGRSAPPTAAAEAEAEAEAEEEEEEEEEE